MPQTPKSLASTRLIRDPAAGPVVFFDSAPTYGHLNGVIEITLTSRLVLPTTDNRCITEIIAAGHLRGSYASMTALRDAIDGALKMAAEPPIKLAS
jgi:hypothetical protein